MPALDGPAPVGAPPATAEKRLSEPPDDAPPTRRAEAIAFVLSSATLGLFTWASFPGLVFGDVTLETLAGLLGRAFFVSVVLERALEVIIATWREPESRALRGRAGELDSRLKAMARRSEETALGLEGQHLSRELAQARRAVTRYRGTTQRYALWTSFVLGMALAGVGVRLLGPLLAVQPTGLQHSLFQLFDILLSGATFAGGSEGLHKLTQALIDFLEATSARAKASSPEM